MNLLGRLERIERLVNPPDDGDDGPEYVRIKYDPDFYHNAGKLPAAVLEQMDDWPDEELIRVS